ncbi:hypothetical protein [Spirosoma sp.]|uniref:hypothetical protein n=1 Tax=Spirosoma sp. TaxID=1899569 RepID=UPI002604A94F|nr:hypothetical protein [Spirosoma sp.]MCX6218560.1 hypothetical protein [Spirosoma sp.]
MIHFLFSNFRWRFILIALLLPITTWAVPTEAVNKSVSTGMVWASDTDGDGVPDTSDLCPGTPAGTSVNAYGCPLTLASCDFTSSTITLKSSGGSGSGTTQYVLADSVGIIVRVSSTATFSGLAGSRTYMALSITHDGSVSNLSVGQPLSSVTATCFDWSDALPIRVCVSLPPPPPPPATCDYRIGMPITLTSAGGSPSTGTLTRYVLVASNGVITQLSSLASFSSVGLTSGQYSAYALIYTDDQSIQNLQVGKAFSTVTAQCLAVSSPLLLTLCDAVCPPSCIPITVRRIR